MTLKKPEHGCHRRRLAGAVMRFAADAGLTVVVNRQESLNLEEVFLHIVNKERAA